MPSLTANEAPGERHPGHSWPSANPSKRLRGAAAGLLLFRQGDHVVAPIITCPPVGRTMCRYASAEPIASLLAALAFPPLGLYSLRLLCKLAVRSTPLGRADKCRSAAAFVLSVATSLFCLAILGMLLLALVGIARCPHRPAERPRGTACQPASAGLQSSSTRTFRRFTACQRDPSSEKSQRRHWQSQWHSLHRLPPGPPCRSASVATMPPACPVVAHAHRYPPACQPSRCHRLARW